MTKVCIQKSRSTMIVKLVDNHFAHDLLTCSKYSPQKRNGELLVKSCSSDDFFKPNVV